MTTGTRGFSPGQISDLELKQLRVFKAVVECGGFTAAEAKLNISRPTISVHIANLEARLNLTLCKRGRAGFALTDEGTVVYQQTVQLLDMLSSFRQTIDNLGASPSGQLKIALSDAFALDQRCRLSEIVARFGRYAPDVELRMDVEHMVDMEERVFNGELDLAFIPYHRTLDGLNYIHLFTDENYLYCAKGHPLFGLPDEQLTDEMLNSSELIHAGLKPHDEVSQLLFEMNLAGSSYHYETRIAMVLSGRYICFLPEEVARPHVEAGMLKGLAMSRKNFALGTAVISKKSSQLNRAKDLFIETINQVFADLDTRAPY